MPQIFEAFSYKLKDQSAEATENRRSARCAFMGRDCDGGGNRDLSDLDLSTRPELKVRFPNREKIRAGVCSIKLTPSGSPWVVCPRRLLALNRESDGQEFYQDKSQAKVLSLLGHAPGTRVGIWSELKFKYKEANKSFDYAFDYIVVPIGRASAKQIETLTDKPFKVLRTKLAQSGYTLSLFETAKIG